MTENQNIVAHQIHQRGGNACDHRNKSVTGFLQGAGISIGQGEGQEAPEHHMQVLQAVLQHLGGFRRVTLSG